MSRRIVLVGLAILLALATARAGVYTDAEPCPFRIRPDGIAEELSYFADNSGQFAELSGKLANAGDPTPGRENPDRAKYLARITDPTRSVASRAIDQLRVREPQAALKTLAPKVRDRNPDYATLAAFAHLAAIRGEWREAIEWHSILLELDPPKELPGTTAEQRPWLAKVERTVYRDWLRIHAKDAATKRDPSDEPIFPLFEKLFPADATTEPGPFTPEQLTHLPPDGVAMVQQLMLWHPDDTRLQWLLAELYAGTGRLREAERLFDTLAQARQMSNRRLLMDHRTSVKNAVKLLPPPVEEAFEIPPEPQTVPPEKPELLAALGLTLWQVVVAGGLFATFSVVLLSLQLRSIRRRYRLR